MVDLVEGQLCLVGMSFSLEEKNIVIMFVHSLWFYIFISNVVYKANDAHLSYSNFHSIFPYFIMKNWCESRGSREEMLALVQNMRFRVCVCG